ncbi:hypothetical protein KC19_VG246100 [Ceratodon purpureus]|uniref:Uncharacterized protein n=1 Tax=Ceratodon purpureus TaxID=3225 RepID=A0A8T0HTZ2_CERPU|nr:hypothetical protein KC19_VG246100 [Ceratodon purpureus]
MQWPSPPSTPPPYPEAHQILLEWECTRGMRGHKLEVLSAFFRKEHLVHLPLPWRCRGFENLEILEPHPLRFLFRRFARGFWVGGGKLRTTTPMDSLWGSTEQSWKRFT